MQMNLLSQFHLADYGVYSRKVLHLPKLHQHGAKSHVFDEKGENMTFSYKKMMKLVKDSGYKGFIGVEYSGMGGNISAIEGIRLTKNLIIKYAKEI